MEKDRDLEKFRRDLQEQILAKVRKTYSSTAIANWERPHNCSRMDAPDGYGKISGSCGDTMEIFLRVRDDIIRDCTFQTDGCGATIACGSAATQIARNRPFNLALAAVSAEEILKVLDGLPEDNVHCAQLAADAFRRALADYLYQKKQPWKKAYRKI